MGGTLLHERRPVQLGQREDLHRLPGGQPQFANAAGDEYRLVSGSPGVEGGVADAVYATFQSRYGIDIRLDAGLNARPQGFAWDIGAYELPDLVPDISVADAATLEGNTGALSLNLAVTLSEPCFHTVQVDFTTVNLGRRGRQRLHAPRRNGDVPAGGRGPDRADCRAR